MEKSRFESAAFGINFFRSDELFLLKEKAERDKILKENEVEVIKFSIDSTQRKAIDILYDDFTKVHFFNAILNYLGETVNVKKFPVYHNCELIEAEFNETDEVRNLIIDIFENDTIGYFNVPFLKNRISAGQELTAILNYIFDLQGKADKGIQFLKDNDINKIIGLTTYSIENNRIYRPYSGILKKYRNSNYYEQLIYTMINYNYSQNLEAIVFGARADNIPLICKYNRLGNVIGGGVQSIKYVFLVSVK